MKTTHSRAGARLCAKPHYMLHKLHPGVLYGGVGGVEQQK